MKESFLFKTELWVPLYTGLKVDNLQDFIRTMRTVDAQSILYHLYINFFNYHSLPSYYANSFAYWLYMNGYRTLAEKISLIDPTDYFDLEEVRQNMLGILEDYKDEKIKGTLEPFYFMSVYRKVFETGDMARDLDEFVRGLRNSSINSIFYHLITSRVEKRRLINDYSQWLMNEGYAKKAEEISKLNIYAFNLYELKEEILRILEEG